MVNLNCLKEIEREATSSYHRIQTRENIIPLTDDMVDVIDYVNKKTKEMILSHPTFCSDYSFWFSHDDRLYRVYTSTRNDVSIQVDSFIGTEEEDETYTFNEFIEDYEVYYYLDLNTMTVKSLYNHKEYIVEEKK